MFRFQSNQYFIIWKEEDDQQWTIDEEFHHAKALVTFLSCTEHNNLLKLRTYTIVTFNLILNLCDKNKIKSQPSDLES